MSDSELGGTSRIHRTEGRLILIGERLCARDDGERFVIIDCWVAPPFIDKICLKCGALLDEWHESAPTSATTATHSQVPSGTTPAEVTPTTVQTPVASSTSIRPSMSPTTVSTTSWDSSLDVKTKPFNGWVIKLPVGSRLVSSRVGESKVTHDLYLLPDGRHLEVVSLTSTFTYDKWADSIYAKYAVSDLTNFYEDFTWCDGMVNGHGEAYILGKNVAVGEADYGKFYAYSTANEASNAVVIEYGVDGHSSWLLKSIFGAERTEEY